jgi:hypothetical protein
MERDKAVGKSGKEKIAGGQSKKIELDKAAGKSCDGKIAGRKQATKKME